MEAGLKDLICRRRLDFVDVQESLEHKLPTKKWKLLEAGLDELENLSNNDLWWFKDGEARVTQTAYGLLEAPLSPSTPT
ncbi:hypothetical protein WJX79_010155 [Trebouxia sp. C0005]